MSFSTYVQDLPGGVVASDALKMKLSTTILTIQHENRGVSINFLYYSGAPYSYLFVNGERRLTEREMLHLQGFPKDYKIVSTTKRCENFPEIPL